MSGASLRRLKLFSFKLNVLLEVTQAINENLPQDELLDRYEKILYNELNIGRVVIFKHNDKWECILNAGLKTTDNGIDRIDVERDLLPVTDITNVTTAEDQFLSKHFDVIIPIYNNNAPLAFVLIGDIDEEMEGISPTIKHLHFIQTLSNIIIVAIENIRLYKESLRQEAIRKELEFASQMQTLLIPDQNKLPQNDELLVATYYHPHMDVGGDYYDFITLDENRIGFCIADVSGKGISAALFMSNFQANLRALFSADIPLDRLIQKLNNRVMEIANGEKFITLFLGRVDKRTKELEFVNAGHNPPIFYDINTKEMIHLTEGCIGLGMLDDIPFLKLGNRKINPNTKILCYTDGLVEFVHENKVEFDISEIEQVLSNDENIDDNIEEIIQNQNVYKGNTAIFDDISILGLQFFK